MAKYALIVARIEAAVNAWLPDAYRLGFSIPHDSPLPPDDPDLDAAPEDLAHVALHSGIRLNEYRRELLRARTGGAVVDDADLTALPTSGRYLIAEIVHLPTGIIAARAYSYDTVRDILTDETTTLAQKRTVIRNAFANLYQTCQDRVAASGWSGP